MLEAVQLSKTYNNCGNIVAVKNISFTAKRGQIVGFLGPNGAGKTTTMKMLTGFLFPSEGKIFVDGIDMEECPLKAKQLIGYLPEGAPAYSDMTVLEFLLFIAEIRGFKGENRYRQIAAVLEQIDLDGVLQQTIYTLSKGYKCRVGLAQALLHDPEIIILDEPTDGLDPNQKQEIRNLIKKIAPEKVIIISTHLLEEVDAICDRVMIINKGEIVIDNTSLELIDRSIYCDAISICCNKLLNAHEIKEKLSNLEEITKVDFLKEEGQKMYLKIYLAANHNAFPKVCNFLFSNNIEIINLQKNSGYLQEVFRKATQHY